MNTIAVLFTLTVFFTVHCFIMKLFRTVEKYEKEEKWKRPPSAINPKLFR